LNRLRKIKKEEELKEDIINKLKSKAKALLGDFG
jgi:predicted small metal-binding protein